MTRFTIASFNVKNLIGADQEYYEFQTYSPEEYAWKKAWLAEQVMSLGADIIGFQEIFEEAPLRDVIADADARGNLLNDSAIPGRSSPYRKKAIFRKLEYTPYGPNAALAFARNSADPGTPGQRRPGLAILSRHGFDGRPEVIQDFDEPVTIPFAPLRGLPPEEAGHYTLRRLSRPILKARVRLVTR